MKSIRWISGGIFIGLGFLFLLGGFGDTGLGLFNTDTNAIEQASTSYERYGYDASMDVTLTGNGKFAFLCLAVGLLLLISANANAWKESGGEY